MATKVVASGQASASALDPSMVRRWVERTCAAQGLPVQVEDAAGIRRLVVLLAGGHGPRRQQAAA